MIKVNREIIDIIIPTYENEQQLIECITSILLYRNSQPVRIIIVNNGKHPIKFENPEVLCLNMGENLGWEGGLKEGLKHSTSQYVMFANDDIFIPISSRNWLRDMVRFMNTFEMIGAIGPSSNVVMGAQNIFTGPPVTKLNVPFLIGFCILLRRKALDECGGIDDMLPGGDDIDLSIRLTNAGYKLIAYREQFVWHHGFQTGTRVHGDHTKPNGWNSREMTDKTNIGLIKKHGLKTFMGTLYGESSVGTPEHIRSITEDVEGNLIRKEIATFPKWHGTEEPRVLELGCGAVKTVPQSVGVDFVPKGEMIPEINDVSVADIVADVEAEIPVIDEFDIVIARHVLEHCVDTITTLKHWIKPLRSGGRLIIAVPDENRESTIGLNSQHVHVFTPESLKATGEVLGLNHVKTLDKESEYSFVIIFEKP